MKLIQLILKLNTNKGDASTGRGGLRFTLYTALFAALLAPFGCQEPNPVYEIRSQMMENRSYMGGPPVIPHEVVGDVIGTTGAKCLYCHAEGVDFGEEKELMGKKGVKAKQTPHPEYINCLQCHVPQYTDDLFVRNSFDGYAPNHLRDLETREEGVPPKMAHQLQNRERCEVCHLSNMSNEALRPRHGPREGCPFCHLPPDALNTYGE